MLKILQVKGSELLPGDIVIITLGDPRSITFFDIAIRKTENQPLTKKFACWKFLFSSGKIRENIIKKNDIFEVWRCT